jgi:hypothetical protein
MHGQPFLNYLSVGVDLTLPPRADAGHLARVFTNIYGLSIGQLAPLPNALYKVVGLDPVRNEIKLERVKDAEVPKDIAIDRSSVAVPANTELMLPANAYDAGSTVELKAIKIGKGQGQKINAAVEVSNTFPKKDSPRESITEVKRFDLAVGDEINLVHGYRFTVRKIVPPDEKRKIIGWVEFTPKRVVEEKK